MFEKEAEDNKPPYAYCALDTKCELWKDGFQKGAEFGYNKAKVEVEESYRESLGNFELNLASVTEQLEELEKANEWHYPSKGDYPKEDKRYLCKIKTFVGGGISYECFDYDTEYSSWKDAIGEVIAWKEIVFPELKESE